MLDSLSKNAQRQCLNAKHCFFTALSIDHDPWHFWDLSDPTTVFLLLYFDSKSH